MRRRFSESYVRRPTRVKFSYKRISCSCVIAERTAGRMLIGVFQGSVANLVRMQLRDNLVPTADNGLRNDLLLQMTSTVFTTVAEPLMFRSVDLGVGMLFS